MPPKKLSKKEMEELKKAEAAKKEEEEKKMREEMERKRIELEQQQKIEEQKRREQERQRILAEKHKEEPNEALRNKKQNEAIKKLQEEFQWRKFVEAEELPSADGADLSTFISQYEQSRQTTNQEILQACQHSEVVVKTLDTTCMNYLATGQQARHDQCQQNIRQIRKITVGKLEDLMVNISAVADSYLEEKQVELTKKISEVKKHDEKGQEDILIFKDDSFRIAVFFNSSSSKNPFRFRPVEIKEFGFKSEIPGKLVSSNLILKFEWTDFDPYSHTTHIPFNIVGGVITIQFFDVLSNAKKMPNWTLKTQYPGREVLDKSRVTNIGQKELFTVTYQLPEYVYLRTADKNNLKIASWDGTKWSLIQTEQPKLEQKTKSLQFQMSKPGSVAYVQDRCTDFPYKSWQLRSVGPDTIHIDIVGRREPFKFEISKNTVRLITKEAELQYLAREGMKPEILLGEMKKVGIDLIPKDDDFEAAGITPKNRQSEEKAVKDICQIVCAYYARSCCEPDSNVYAKLRDNLQYDELFLEDQEKDWKKVQWWGDKCNYVTKEKTNSHYNIELLIASENEEDKDCLKRIQSTEAYVLKDTLARVLRLTRLLSFVKS